MGSALFSAFAFAPAVQAQSVPDPSQSDAASPVQDAPSQGVGDIVVTARRRSESLKNTPVAVTAITGAALEQKGATNISAVAQSFPSLTFNTTAGHSGASKAAVLFNPEIGSAARRDKGG